MHYAEDVRRFNLLSGFVLGALVGAGVALITLPGGTRTTTKKIRRTVARAERGARRVERRALDGVQRVRDGAGLTAARKGGRKRPTHRKRSQPRSG